MKGKDVVKDIEAKEFEVKRKFAEDHIETSMSIIEGLEWFIEDNKRLRKILDKKLRKAQKKHTKLLEKDINDFEPKSYVTLGDNRVEVTDWSWTASGGHLATTDSYSNRCAVEEMIKVAHRTYTVKDCHPEH